MTKSNSKNRNRRSKSSGKRRRRRTMKVHKNSTEDALEKIEDRGGANPLTAFSDFFLRKKKIM